MSLTTSYDVDRPSWRLASARASLFPATMLDVPRLNVWGAIAAATQLRTDQLQFVPMQQRTQSGEVANGTLQLQISPQRIDLFLTPDARSAASGGPPAIENLAAGLGELEAVAAQTLDTLGTPFVRLAFAAQVMKVFAPGRGNIRALCDAVLGLPVREEDQDITFQRGSRHRLDEGPPGINLVEKWSAVTLQMVPTFVTDPATLGYMALSAANVLLFDVEANTIMEAPIPFDPERARAVMKALALRTKSLMIEEV